MTDKQEKKKDDTAPAQSRFTGMAGPTEQELEESRRRNEGKKPTQVEEKPDGSTVTTFPGGVAVLRDAEGTVTGIRNPENGEIMPVTKGDPRESDHVRKNGDTLHLTGVSYTAGDYTVSDIVTERADGSTSRRTRVRDNTMPPSRESTIGIERTGQTTTSPGTAPDTTPGTTMTSGKGYEIMRDAEGGVIGLKLPGFEDILPIESARTSETHHKGGEGITTVYMADGYSVVDSSRLDGSDQTTAVVTHHPRRGHDATLDTIRHKDSPLSFGALDPVGRTTEQQPDGTTVTTYKSGFAILQDENGKITGTRQPGSDEIRPVQTSTEMDRKGNDVTTSSDGTYFINQDKDGKLLSVSFTDTDIGRPALTQEQAGDYDSRRGGHHRRHRDAEPAQPGDSMLLGGGSNFFIRALAFIFTLLSGQNFFAQFGLTQNGQEMGGQKMNEQKMDGQERDGQERDGQDKDAPERERGRDGDTARKKPDADKPRPERKQGAPAAANP